jgi:hypothetical protein
MDRSRALCAVALLSASALAMVGCSPEDDLAGDLAVASEGALDAEVRAPPKPPKADARPTAAQQARIELMTSDARASVVRAANFLAELTSFRVTADIAFDVRQSDGRLLEFGARREFTIRRPDRLRIDATERDGEKKTLYFDGSTISIDLPGHRAFVREEISGTYYAALEKLSDELDAPVPLANLLSENFASPLDDQLSSGYYVGHEEIDGRRCEHLSFRLPDVDVQLWIEEGDRPLIARIVIAHKREDGTPQFRATLHDWALGLETAESLFQFDPVEGAQRLTVEAVIDEKTSDRAGRVE